MKIYKITHGSYEGIPYEDFVVTDDPKKIYDEFDDIESVVMFSDVRVLN